MPAEAARVSGPRDKADISHAIWKKIKAKVGVDFEKPLLVSQWKKGRNFEKEFMPLSACTETEHQANMLLTD